MNDEKIEVNFLEGTAPPPEEFDPVAFAREFLRDDDGVIEEIDPRTVGKDLIELYNSVIKLPNPSDAAIVAAFTMIPSRLSQIVPVLFIKGEAGSCKSDLINTMADVLKVQTYQGNSTSASIKNLINAVRWSDPETFTHEKQCHLLIDNLEIESFDPKQQLLGATLNGYKRKTDIQFISGGMGKNIEFRTFCPKAFTTVWDYDSKELARRSLVIRTKKYIELDGYSFSQPRLPSIRAVVSKYWTKQQNCLEFAKQRRSEALQWSKTCSLKKEQYDLTIDMLTAGLVSGVWESPDEAFQHLATFFADSKKQSSPLDRIILDALEAAIQLPRNQWHTIPASIKVDVKPQTVKKAIDDAVTTGIVKKPSLDRIQEVVKGFGFILAPGSGGGIYYRMTNEARKQF
jgi:hypothetical protein